jgi:hypothetical protein
MVQQDILLAQLFEGSHAIVPIIPKKVCCILGKKLGSGDR